MASLSFHATWEQRAPLEVRPLEVSRSHPSTVIYPPLLTSTLVSKSSNQPEPFPHSQTQTWLCSVLKIEPRLSYTLGKCSVTGLHLESSDTIDTGTFCSFITPTCFSLEKCRKEEGTLLCSGFVSVSSCSLVFHCFPLKLPLPHIRHRPIHTQSRTSIIGHIIRLLTGCSHPQ